MNKQVIINIVLATVLVILSIRLAYSTKKENNGNSDYSQKTSAIIDNIMTRTSIRAYENRDVEPEKVETMLRAAMAAPSAGNKQPWKFIVIKDKNTLTAISGNMRTMRMAKEAPLAIVVCGDMNKTFEGNGLDYWVEDTSAATENLLLAAHGLGLGAVWCGIYPLPERVSFLQDLLKLPENIIPLNVIPVGYPAEFPEPKDKWNPESVHYEFWNGADTQITSVSSKELTKKDWKKLDVKELRDNPFTFFSDALALSVGNKDKMNSMTIGWGGLGVLWGRERPVVTVYVEKRRHTHSLMENNEYFTVTAFTPAHKDALKYLGTVSGRDEDKMKGSGLTVGFTQSGNPIFEEGRLLLECKKLYGAPFDPSGFGELAKQEYSNRPLHSVYIGEIVNAWKKD